MIIAYVIAALFAMAAAYRAAWHEHLAYWRRWDKAAVRFYLTPVYLLHALTGIAVTGLAFHQGWEPLGSGAGRYWLDGVVYGAGAAALLRLEVTTFELSPISPARTLLHIGLERFQNRLDAAARRAVSRKLGDLQVTALRRVSWRLFLHHFDDLTASERLTIAEWLRDLQRQATGAAGAPAGTTLDQEEAEERLRFFCESLITICHDATVDLGEPPTTDEGR